MPSFLRDVCFSARILLKNPGFTVAAIVILALGIGANTAMFTVVSALLLRPFAYHDPQALVSVDAKDKAADRCCTLLRYELVRDRSQSFQAVAAWANDTFDLTGHGEPLQVPVARVTPSFFPMLGVQPQLGRVFREDEGRIEGAHVVMLSDAIWRSRFGSDPKIIGQTVTLDTEPHTVVGILPADAQFPFIGQADVWTPRYFELTLMTPQRLRMGVGYLNMLARLRLASVVQKQISAVDADQPVTSVQTVDQLMDSSRAQPRFTMLLLGLFSLAALILAVIGIYGVLAYSVAQRRHEMAIRLALGAERGDILRLVVRQGLGLALVGIAVGLCAAFLMTRLMSSMLYDVSARDLTTFAIAPVIFLCIALLASYLPARRATRLNPLEVLREG